MHDHDPTRRDRGADDAGPSRAVIVAFVFVAILAVAGYFGTKALIHMGRLQDCAATGRRDC